MPEEQEIVISPWYGADKELNEVRLFWLLSVVLGKDRLLAKIAGQVKAHSEGYDVLEKEQAQKAHVLHPVNPGYGNNRAGSAHDHGAGCKEDDDPDEPS
jgi:hypothetical protein